MKSKNVIKAKVVDKDNIKGSVVVRYSDEATFYVDIDSMKTPLKHLLYDYVASNYDEWTGVLLRNIKSIKDNMLTTSCEENKYVDLNDSEFIEQKKENIFFYKAKSISKSVI